MIHRIDLYNNIIADYNSNNNCKTNITRAPIKFLIIINEIIITVGT